MSTIDRPLLVLLFACGNKLVEMRTDLTTTPNEGETVFVEVTDQTTMKVCPCCNHTSSVVKEVDYKVVSHKVMGKGWDGLLNALNDRPWELENEWYDTYSLVSDLRIDDWDSIPKIEVVLVEVC